MVEGPYDVIHDVIVCKSYVFVDSQGTRLFFSCSQDSAYSNSHTVSCEKIICDMNTRVYFYYEKKFHRLSGDSARNNIDPNNKHRLTIRPVLAGTVPVLRALSRRPGQSTKMSR